MKVEEVEAASTGNEDVEMAGLEFFTYGGTIDLTNDSEEEDSATAGPSRPVRQAKNYHDVRLRLKRPTAEDGLPRGPQEEKPAGGESKEGVSDRQERPTVDSGPLAPDAPNTY